MNLKRVRNSHQIKKKQLKLVTKTDLQLSHHALCQIYYQDRKCLLPYGVKLPLLPVGTMDRQFYLKEETR